MRSQHGPAPGAFEFLKSPRRIWQSGKSSEADLLCDAERAQTLVSAAPRLISALLPRLLRLPKRVEMSLDLAGKNTATLGVIWWFGGKQGAW